MVPVKREGKPAAVLAARLSRQHLANLLQEPMQDFDVTSSLVDGSGRIVSRNRDFDRFFARPATNSYLAAIRTAPQGFARSTTLDGKSVLVAWERLDNGWTVGVGLDPAPHEALLRSSILKMAAVGAGLLALSLFAALRLSRRIAGAIHRAAQDADAMAQELPVPGGRSEIVQIDRLLQAHQEASSRLQALGAERNQALSGLREELRRRDEFLSMLAHELRNPLAPVANVLWLLDRSPALGEKERQGVAILGRQTRQLTRLVDDLLDASRLVTGKLTLKPRPVSLTTLVRQAAQAMDLLAGGRRQRIEVETPAAPVEGMVDPERFSQILQNLLGNAIKFGPEGGTLRLTLEADGGWARIQVRDDGIGIDPARLEDIFKPFVQVDPGIDRAGGGLGLGLSTARQLAAMHGGTLTAYSEGLGQGAVFTLTLPLGRLPAANGENPRPADQ
jgi:signal transduction histidine kinase